MSEVTKILVVEDEHVTQHAVKTILDKAGYQVIVAGNGQEGLDALKKEKADLVISDIVMPVMNGFDFYKKLKLEMALRDIPVLILTSHDEMEDPFRVLGIDGFIVKPFQAEDLLNRSYKILHRDKVNHFEAKKILVVGQMKEIMMDMIQQLRDENCDTARLALNDDEMFSGIQELDPDIIALELEMGDQSVFERIQMIRTSAFGRGPIVVYDCQRDSATSRKTIIDSLLDTESKEDPFFSYMGNYNKSNFTRKINKCLAKMDI